MPEEIEIDTDSLRETIDEEIEKEGKGGARLIRWIALSTAILATLAAIASLEAGATVNEALVLKTESTRLQSQARGVGGLDGGGWSGDRAFAAGDRALIVRYRLTYIYSSPRDAHRAHPRSPRGSDRDPAA